MQDLSLTGQSHCLAAECTIGKSLHLDLRDMDAKLNCDDVEWLAI